MTNTDQSLGGLGDASDDQDALSGRAVVKDPAAPHGASEERASEEGASEEGAVEEGFSKSIVVSAVRCLLTYVVFPFVTPIVSFAADIGPWVGVTLGTFAIFANLFSIKRFWKAQHKWRKPVTVVHVGIIILLVVLVFLDFREILT